MKYIVNGDQYVRVRLLPSSSAPIVGAIPTGSVIEVDSITGEWAKVKVKIGDVTIMTEGDLTNGSSCYMYAPLLSKPVIPVPPPVSKGYRVAMGVHTLADGAALRRAHALGCRVFTVMSNSDVANEYAIGDPNSWTPDRGDSLVFYRQYHEPNGWSPREMVQQLTNVTRFQNNNIVYTLVNEWDGGIPGAASTPSGMEKFCLWTNDCIKMLNDINISNIAIMTSSMGTPDFTNQGVCDMIQKYWAPLWNNGTIKWLDMHTYSPNKDSINKDGTVWYERRWEFLYTKCGFNPTSSGKIISTETGVDEGGVGGFPAHGMGRAEIDAWVKRFYQVQSAPIVIGGMSYPSPFFAGTIFQFGDSGVSSGHWGGYNVEGNLPFTYAA